MDSAAKPSERRSVDPVWTTIKESAQTAATNEPVLAGMLHATITSQPRFESALSYHLARLAGTTEVPAALIRQIFEEAFTADPAIGLAARFDIVAVSDRDPACTSYLDPLLWFKGYYLGYLSKAPKCCRAAKCKISVIGSDVENARNPRQRFI